MSRTAPEHNQPAQFAPTIKDNLPAQHLPGEFAITPRSAPAASLDEGWFDADGSMSIHNVSAPTVTPFLPDPDKATGAGVVIAPGGGFLMLSVATEGWDVARWLADHGVAAFVVKYRTLPTAATGVGGLRC